jgi:glutamyl-tRNA synthetase
MQLNLIYPCICSRNSLSIRPCSCRHSRPSLSGLEFSFKLALPEQADVTVSDALSRTHFFFNTKHEDPIVWKKNGTAAYHLGSVTDDLHFEISHILRGEDLIAATVIQFQLAKLAGLSAFQNIQIGHHPLLLDSGGEKFSKSSGSRSVMPELQQNPALLLREFAIWAGLPKAVEIQRLRDILQIPVDKS